MPDFCDIKKIRTKLEKVIHARLPGPPEPPRLVRANSAFDLFGLQSRPMYASGDKRRLEKDVCG